MAKKRSTASHRQPQNAATRKEPQKVVMNSGKMMEMINNVLFSRSSMFRRLFDPRRSIDDDCGYPQNVYEITNEDYRSMYDREAIANRVVSVLPSASWQVGPTVIEDEDLTVDTDFEIALRELTTRPKGSSWLKSDKGPPLWEYLHRADRLSGIGRYGVILLGIDDGRKLHEPAEGIDERGEKTGNAKGRKLIYVRTLDESLAQALRYEADTSNPRYGLPLEYNLTFTDPNLTPSTGVDLQHFTQKVHWSRVVHLADNLGSSEVFGVPRMQPVWNRLLDLRKLYGGSAEMYWKGAFPGLSLETHPLMAGEINIDVNSLKTMMENYMNSLQRYIVSKGLTAKSLATQVVDPTPQIEAQLQAICIQIDVPKRVFMGTERGQLASSQDDSAWNDTVRARQNEYVTSRVISPTIDRLIMLGVLPEPKTYEVVWPDLDALTATEQATIAVQRTDALAKFVQGGVNGIIHPVDFLVRILGMSQEEADAVLETVATEEPILEHEEEETGEEKEGSENL